MLSLHQLARGAFLSALATALPAQTFDFEQDSAGTAPRGWSLPVSGSEFSVEDQGAAGGEHCARLHRGEGNSPVRNAMRSFDATAHRGKLVTLSAKMRVRKNGRAQAWLRVDRPDQQTGFFDNMQERPVLAATWQTISITGLVAADAERIAFGFLLLAGDDLWLDDVELTFADASNDDAPGAPAPLSVRGLDNVIAFARLVGYVRHFHPSDAAAALDWERFTIEGMRDIEAATDAASLAKALQTRFAAVAPTLRVVETDAAKAVQLPPPDGADELQCVAWQHTGVGLSEQSIYKSKRTFRKLSRRGDLPDPATPLRIDLPGEVTCFLPVAVYAQDGATLPASTSPELPRRPQHGGEDRSTRLAAVALAWNVFEHFYPYFDVVGGDWHAALRTALASAATDADELAFLATMQRLVAELHDGHGNVHLASDGRYAAPPFAIGWIEEQLVVTAANEALADTVAVGDVIVSLDGAPAAQAFAAAKKLHSGATDGWLRHRAENSLLLGAQGSELTVRLRRADGAEIEQTFVRQQGRQPQPARPAPQFEIEPGIWYLDVDRLTDKDFDAARPDLQKARAIVIDFRGYPRGMSPQKLFGHFLTEPAQSARWCVPQVQLPDRSDMQCKEAGRWNLRPLRPHIEARLVFITGASAISYAESCMGIVEHYRLGEIVGERTAGTNGNVNPFSVPGKLTISWTGMQVLKHDGSVHHGVGIAPTVPVHRTVAGVRAGVDEFLAKALEVARGDGK